MSNATVWVVQDNGKNNLILAQRFGTIKTLLPARLQLQMDATETIEIINEKLAEFNDEDSLLAAGDPSCIGIATAMAAAMNNGVMHMVKFDRQAADYYRIKIDMRAIKTRSA